jgi:serine phosphatase RsbU (regulator of sigma subunit)
VLKHADGTVVPRWTKVRREDSNHDTIRISKTIVNQVMDSKEAILSADAANDERFDMSQSIADFRIRSMMCAPLIDSDGKSFGVLQIDTLDQRNRFEENDLGVLVAVAAQAAVAIDNARMHDNALLQRSMERDLALAHQVQQGFLPKDPPEMPGYEFFDFYQPANHVGGDYFDYVDLPDGRLAILVADVVGHGVAAALLMAKLSAEARFNLVAETNPAKSLSLLNRAICALPFEDRFITMIMMILDPATGKIEVANAGHMCPILRRRDGTMTEPGEEQVGIPLGIVDDFDYEPFTFEIAPGDLAMVYTDGVNESMDKNEDFYGIDRIRKQISHTSSARPGMLGQFIVDDVRRFMGDAPQSDDMCFVLLCRD